MKWIIIMTAILSGGAGPAAPSPASTYQVTGELVGTKVEAFVDTDLTFTPDATPAVRGVWTVKPAADAVFFKGDLSLDKHTVETDAGLFGGTAVAPFTGISHKVQGKARWDSQKRRLTYEIPVGESNAGGGSVYQGKAISCKGSSMICDAIGKTNGAWEGLKVNLQFSNDMSRFQGTVMGYEHGGSGMTDSITESHFRITGVLQK